MSVLVVGTALLLLYLFVIRKIWPVYLNGTDALWLGGGDKARTVIHAVLKLKAPLSRAQLAEFIESSFLSHRRFRQKPVMRTWLWPYWTDDTAFSLDNHIQVHDLTQDNNEALASPLSSSSSSAPLRCPSHPLSASASKSGHHQIESMVSTLLETPLDTTRPPWMFHLIVCDADEAMNEASDDEDEEDVEEGAEKEKEKRKRESYSYARKKTSGLKSKQSTKKKTYTVVFRVHHCMGDGIGLMRCAVNLLKPTSVNGKPALRQPSCASSACSESSSSGSSSESSSSSPYSSRSSSSATPKANRKKKSSSWTLAGLWHISKGVVTSCVKLVLMCPDANSPLKADTVTTKVRASWSDHPVSLSHLKRIARACRCSVNDIFFAVITGALRKYLLEVSY